MPFRGAFPALITPFGENDEIDLSCFANLIEWHIQEGSAGLVVAGSTGESFSLSREERYQLIRNAVKIANGRVPIIAGAGSNSTAEAVRLTHLAKDAGADAVLHVTGYYNKPTQSQMIGHFQAIDATNALPILLYNVPSRTGVELSVDTVVALSRCENIIGIKDATANVARVTQERVKINKPFDFLSGDDSTVLGYLAQGGAGCISVSANVVPNLYAAMINAGLAGDFQKAREIQDKLIDLHTALFVEPSPGGIKYAMSKLGLCKNISRLPMTVVSERTRQMVDDAISFIDVAQ